MSNSSFILLMHLSSFSSLGNRVNTQYWLFPVFCPSLDRLSRLRAFRFGLTATLMLSERLRYYAEREGMMESYSDSEDMSV